MKTFSIIYNPVASNFKQEVIDSLICRFVSRGLTLVDCCKSQYSGHVIPLIKELDPVSDLIITVGGDGTVNEAFRAFYEIEQHCAYAHVSVGTTNDMANNYGLPRHDPIKAVEMLSRGHTMLCDSFTVNDEPVAYVSSFGDITAVPYLTNNTLKNVIGHAAYVVSALPVIVDPFREYDVKLTHDGIEEQVSCMIGLITNSRGFGGISLYPDVSLNDAKFEVCVVRGRFSRTIAASLLKDYLADTVDMNNYEKIAVAFKTDSLDVEFIGKPPRYEVDNDGNKASFTYKECNNILRFRIGKKIKILLPGPEKADD